MPAEPAELWAFYIAAASVVAILVIAVGAAVIVSQRKFTTAARDYASRQVAALDEERSRVARELHDDVSQQIAVLSHLADQIQESLDDATARPRIEAAAEALEDGLWKLAASVRGIAHQMHPSALEHLGLGPALTSLVRETALGSGLQIQMEMDEPPPELPPIHALAFYRIAQEALRNVRRHAKAAHVYVRIVRSDQHTLLEISDDGVGLPVNLAPRTAGLGLVSMRERVRLLGGELTITSTPDRGTSVQAKISRDDGAPG
jgi:signal transduction histidine kinase